MKDNMLNFGSELRVSAKWVIVVLLALTVIVLLASECMPDAQRRVPVEILGVSLYPMLGLAWVLESWRPRLGRALTIVILAAIIVAARLWLGIPGTLALMAFPIGLAAAMLSLVAAAVAALLQSGLLFLLAANSAAGIEWAETVVALAAIWASLGMMCAVYHPLYQLKHWMWEYLGRAQVLLHESLDRKADLAQALEDLHNANRQLALANERLAALRAIAEEAQRGKAAFVARVSHEFRTPLNMIIGLVGIMVENPKVYAEELPPDLWQDLEVVHRNSLHLASMINDVLDLSQAEVGRLVLRWDWCDLRTIVEGVLLAVHPMADKKELVLHMSVPDDLPQIYCDGMRIRQVLLNLVSNAARFTEKGEIEVRIVKRDENVVVCVADSGPGISSEDAGRIFEPFYQGTRNDIRAGEGSGLGLSISKQLVHLHGGQMWLESELGVGALFYFSLPASLPPEPVDRPDRWLVRDWEWRERAFETSRAYSVERMVRPRIVVYDETGGLWSELAHYADEIEFVALQEMSQVADVLQRYPAHGLMLNVARQDRLCLLVENATRQSPETPVIGCSVPQQVMHARQRGALGHLIKPVTHSDLESAIRAVGKPIRRVLIVDDELEVLELWTRTLHLHDDTIEVATVSSGRQALEVLDTGSPDLVLLDVAMPGMDGWQVLDHIRQDEGKRDIPVIVVSGKDPIDQPPESQVLVAAMGEGLSINCLLRCSLDLASHLLKLDRELAPALG